MPEELENILGLPQRSNSNTVNGESALSRGNTYPRRIIDSSIIQKFEKIVHFRSVPEEIVVTEKPSESIVNFEWSPCSGAR